MTGFIVAIIAWAVIPFNDGWGPGRSQRAAPLYLRDLARGLRRDHGRLGVELEIPVPGSLRSAAQMISYEVSIGLIIIGVINLHGSLNFGAIVAAQDGGVGVVQLVLACRILPMDVPVLHLGLGGNKPAALRPARGGIGTGGGLPGGILLDALPAVHGGANTSPSS